MTYSVTRAINIIMKADEMMKDTIPRVTKVGYFEELLAGIEKGEKFEQLRQRLINAQARLGRSIMPRVSDSYTMWAPTADALEEFMRLGFIETCSLPSRRQYVDTHRNTIYTLTPDGQRMSSLFVQQQHAEFYSQLSEKLLRKHPYFHQLLVLCGQWPLLVPEYNEQDLIAFRSEAGRWFEVLARDAAKKLGEHKGEANSPSEVDIANELIKYIIRRFGNEQPARKDLLHAVNDALASITLASRDLLLDPVSLDTLVSLGKQLLVLNDSRYVIDWPGRTLWATATIRPDGTIARRGIKEYGNQIMEALVSGYEDVVSTHHDKLVVKFPYVHIYLVRTQAAFRTKVNNALVDRILSEMVTGERKVDVNVDVSLGNGILPPPSEPVFRIEGKEYYVLSMQPKTDRRL